MYFPAGNTTGSAGLTHLATVYYDRLALTSLRTKFMFWKLVDDRTLPKKNGKTIQFYRYSNFGANTTASTEGSVGDSLNLTTTTVSASVSQYTDFISFSDLLVDTAIDNDIIAVGADQLGYRGGLTFDTIVRNEVDSIAASIDVALLGDYFSANDLANIRARFAGLNIRPMQSSYYTALIHPYITYDFKRDPQVGGFIDVVKQHPDMQGNDRIFTLEDRGWVANFEGFSIWESTNVKVTSGSPNTYRCYFGGQEALAAIDLAGRGPTRTEDQNKTKFKVTVQRTEPSVANPEGKIAGFVSYNVVFVAKNLDTNPYRLRKIDAATSLGL